MGYKKDAIMPICLMASCSYKVWSCADDVLVGMNEMLYLHLYIMVAGSQCAQLSLAPLLGAVTHL